MKICYLDSSRAIIILPKKLKIYIQPSYQDSYG